MGPITIEGIIGDGAIYHADRDCAPLDSWPCEEHGEWCCERCPVRCGEEGCTTCVMEYSPLFSTSGLDGSECCDRCTMPLDQAAFDYYMEQERREAHERHTDNEPYCDLCAEEKADAEAESEAEAREYTDACAICHADSCSC